MIEQNYMRLGIDVLLKDSALQKKFHAKKIAFLGHEASVNCDVQSTLDLLCKHLKLNVVKIFGPQHGFCSDKQDDMKESDDFLHPEYKIPVCSLYGEVRRPRDKDLQDFDVFMVDLQDIGCRIYTYVTTLLYVLEAAAVYKKKVVVLDRPNPIGRKIEGFNLDASMVSFVGAHEGLGYRHGLTMGELALFFKDKAKLDVDLEVIKMQGWDPNKPGEFWENGTLAWVNPSPNVPLLSTTRAFCGTVFLEGTKLSEARGTTRPLDQWGHPKAQPRLIFSQMQKLQMEWTRGVAVRECHFEPTFHKFAKEMCKGFQLHCEHKSFQDEVFQPVRFFALLFKVLRTHHDGLLAWREPPYEYEYDRLAIDLLSGSTRLREWVDDRSALPEDLNIELKKHEQAWEQARKQYLLY